MFVSLSFGQKMKIFAWTLRCISAERCPDFFCKTSLHDFVGAVILQDDANYSYAVIF